MGLLDLYLDDPDGPSRLPDDTTPLPSEPPAPPPVEPGGANYYNPGPSKGGGQPGAGLSARPSFNIGDAPSFAAPQFSAPSFQDAMNEPGFQFRIRAGQEGLERSAAARGVLRSGGTLKDISEYNQNFASSEYDRVFQRQLSAFDRRYQGAKDEHAPRLATWNLRGNAEIQAALAQFNREWQRYALEHQGGGGGTNIPPPP